MTSVASRSDRGYADTENDAALVQVAEDVQELPRDDARFRFVDADAAGEGFALDELLGEIEAEGRALAFAEGVDQAGDLRVRDGAEESGLALESIELLRGRNEGEHQLLERDHDRRSLGAVRPSMRRLRQHRQHAERSRARGGAATRAAVSAQRSGARRAGRGVHSAMMTSGLDGTTFPTPVGSAQARPRCAP